MAIKKKKVIWIIHTTKYRKGSDRLSQVAHTLARKRAVSQPECEVICKAVFDKKAFVQALDSLVKQGKEIQEFHFVGHAGMYGPMFGTTNLPEQFSPYEWNTLTIPFAKKGEAFFHACRSARWFAPFFARTFKIPSHGYHWYTAFSKSDEKFVLAPSWTKGDLYLLGCPGRKSHGVLGSLAKHSGVISHEKFKPYLPPVEEKDASYDKVAELYDEVFQDIKVRKDEWNWLQSHLPQPKKKKISLLDIGCGNGAMLRELRGQISLGVGVDASAEMVKIATMKNEVFDHLSFQKIEGPFLPFEDRSFDVVTSFLSFRYLDWDPMMKEILRILKPGGRVLIIDMVTAPVKLKEFPKLIRSKGKQMSQHRRNKKWRDTLTTLSKDARWIQMLELNPIRSDHEMRWYLESRFPGQKVDLINVGWQNRVLAFDSGPVFSDYIAPQSYP